MSYGWFVVWRSSVAGRRGHVEFGACLRRSAGETGSSRSLIYSKGSISLHSFLESQFSPVDRRA